MPSPSVRIVLLGAIAACTLATPALAGVAGEARVSGQYKVVYVKVAGLSGGISGSRVWAVVPTCSVGACSLRVRSRPTGERAGYPLPFDFDGTTYQNVQNSAQGGPCTRQDGSIIVANGYSAAILSRFRVTRMSASGRALTFKGTLSERYTVNAAGRAHGCGAYYTSTERYTGYAVTQ